MLSTVLVNFIGDVVCRGYVITDSTSVILRVCNDASNAILSWITNSLSLIMKTNYHLHIPCCCTFNTVRRCHQPAVRNNTGTTEVESPGCLEGSLPWELSRISIKSIDNIRRSSQYSGW